MAETSFQLEQWSTVDAAWVLRGGERVGWISPFGHWHVNAYNRENTYMGKFADADAAVAAFGDERFQDWRLIDVVRAEMGLPLVVPVEKQRRGAS